MLSGEMKRKEKNKQIKDTKKPFGLFVFVF